MRLRRISQLSQSDGVENPKIFQIFSTLKGAKRIEWRETIAEWHKHDNMSSRSFLGYVKNIDEPIAKKTYSYVLEIYIQKTDENNDIAIIKLLLNKLLPTEHLMETIGNWKFNLQNDQNENDFRKFMSDTFGAPSFKTPYEESKAKVFKRTRLTRMKRTQRNIPATALYITVEPKRKGGHDVYYINQDLETGFNNPKKLIQDQNEDGSELTGEQALEIMNKHIENAKTNGFYVDETSLDYIPEEANQENWDFILNTWKKDAPTANDIKDIKEELEMLGKNNTQYKTAQDFQGYFAGNVPDYAVGYLGTSSVEASQIEAMFGKAHEAINLVNRFDSSLLTNISFIFNFAKSGAYGVYLSALDRAIKTKALKQKLEQNGYEIKISGEGLTAFPKKDMNKTPEEIQRDIDAIYQDLQSKGGAAIGINMNSVLSAARADISESNFSDPDAWQWIAILHLGGTIAHEAIHAKGAEDEGPSEQVEQRFIQWALPIVNEEYRKEAESKGKEFNPLTITNRQRHAESKNWYKEAQRAKPPIIHLTPEMQSIESIIENAKMAFNNGQDSVTIRNGYLYGIQYNHSSRLWATFKSDLEKGLKDYIGFFHEPFLRRASAINFLLKWIEKDLQIIEDAKSKKLIKPTQEDERARLMREVEKQIDPEDMELISKNDSWHKTAQSKHQLSEFEINSIVATAFHQLRSGGTDTVNMGNYSYLLLRCTRGWFVHREEREKWFDNDDNYFSEREDAVTRLLELLRRDLEAGYMPSKPRTPEDVKKEIRERKKERKRREKKEIEEIEKKRYEQTLQEIDKTLSEEDKLLISKSKNWYKTAQNRRQLSTAEIDSIIQNAQVLLYSRIDIFGSHNSVQVGNAEYIINIERGAGDQTYYVHRSIEGGHEWSPTLPTRNGAISYLLTWIRSDLVAGRIGPENIKAKTSEEINEERKKEIRERKKERKRREKQEIEEIEKKRYEQTLQEIDKTLSEEDKMLISKSRGWYKTAQLGYYTPKSFMNPAIGSDLAGRFPFGIQSEMGQAGWSMMAQQDQSVPIEKRLSREYMSPLPKDLSQEHDIIEEQLRKYTRPDKKLDPKATMTELLSEGYDPDRGYIIMENLLDEKRPKPLLVPLQKSAAIKKIATLFGWMNNLSISDGSTIPGLGDRVMAWDDRDEDFAEDETWIKQQPRYNPTYDIKGFYYRWIEPRFRPELFDDMTRDYSNVHPAKRFASVNETSVMTVLSILSHAKSMITNKKIFCTRFLVSEDMMPLIDKVFMGNDIKINVFEVGNDSGEDILAVYVGDSSILDDDIERVEKRLQKKSEEKIDDVMESLFGLKEQEKRSVSDVTETTNDICKDCNINNIDLKIEDNKLEFAGGNYDQLIKVGSLVAERLGVINTNINASSLSFNYGNININFKGE